MVALARQEGSRDLNLSWLDNGTYSLKLISSAMVSQTPLWRKH
jgi:hypothetical protein